MRELHAVALDLRRACSEQLELVSEDDDVAQVVVRERAHFRHLEDEVVVLRVDVVAREFLLARHSSHRLLDDPHFVREAGHRDRHRVVHLVQLVLDLLHLTRDVALPLLED